MSLGPTQGGDWYVSGSGLTGMSSGTYQYLLNTMIGPRLLYLWVLVRIVVFTVGPAGALGAVLGVVRRVRVRRRV